MKVRPEAGDQGSRASPIVAQTLVSGLIPGFPRRVLLASPDISLSFKSQSLKQSLAHTPSVSACYPADV